MLFPDVSFGLSSCLKVTDADSAAAKKLNKLIPDAVRKTFALRYVRLDPKSLGVSVFADASFAFNPDLTCQPRLVIALSNADGK